MTSPTRSPTTSTTRGLAATGLTATALAVLLLTGCAATAGHGDEHSTRSDASTAAASGQAQHSDADVAFATGMVAHHQGALTMAQDAAQRASTPEVRALAGRVVQAQQPEIDQMQGWLTAWDEDGADDAGHSGMAGMDDGDPAALAAATGTAYDRLFLEQMTAHHRDAVEMAQQERAGGSSPDAVALAERIEADQTAEIAEMAGLLQQLGG